MKNTTENHFSWKRLYKVALPFWISEKKWVALGLLLLVVSGLIIVAQGNRMVTIQVRRFTTALNNYQAGEFYAGFWAAVTIYLVTGPIDAFSQSLRTELYLVWRLWLTKNLVRRLLKRKERCRVDNPEERITAQADTFCATCIGLSLVVVNSTITVVTFGWLLCGQSPLLALAAIGYSVAGSLIAAQIGRPLMPATFEQSHLEADARFELGAVRGKGGASSADPARDAQAEDSILACIARAVENSRSIMKVNRRLNMFAIPYNNLASLLPYLLMAPLYLHLRLGWGDILSAQMAFMQVFTGMTLLVNQYPNIASFATNINRIGGFIEELEEPEEPEEGAP